MEPSTIAANSRLRAVALRRSELREALGTVEHALAAPTRDVGWGEAVHRALLELADDFAAHVEVTEGEDGLHQSILGGDLRLTNAVRQLAYEHATIGAQIAELVAATDSAITTAQAGEVRDRANHLLGAIVRHRQRGADLIYEAFETDIGGGD